MEIRIGVIWSSQVVELELGDEAKADEVQAQIEKVNAEIMEKLGK